MNLVLNARDAMPNGGQISVETGNAELRQSFAGASGPATPGKYVTLVLNDNGCGMDAETKSHIFEPFFTTKERGKGTGLGLAIVFGIVKQNSGHIFVQSEPGHGTTFKIYLPRVEGAVQLDDSKTPNVSLQGYETILLVEDEEAVRESTAEYLAENGYTVLKAKEGSDALEIAGHHTQPIHLLLTDLVMPQMSGRELAQRIADIHPETRVVFMSGYTNNMLSKQHVLDPHHVLLRKPFRLTVLAQRVRETLDRSSAATAGK
jgi:CheY-like chemotaxis protein